MHTNPKPLIESALRVIRVQQAADVTTNTVIGATCCCFRVGAQAVFLPRVWQNCVV